MKQLVIGWVMHDRRWFIGRSGPWARPHRDKASAGRFTKDEADWLVSRHDLNPEDGWFVEEEDCGPPRAAGTPHTLYDDYSHPILALVAK